MVIVMVPRFLCEASFSSVTTICLLLTASIGATVDADKKPCPDEARVNLTNAIRNATGFISESGHFFPADILRNEEGVLLGCMCDVKPCIPLCPPLRKKSTGKILGPEYFRNTTAEIPQVYTTSRDVDDLPLEPNQWFHLFVWDPCKTGGAYFLDSDKYKNDEWYLMRNGSLFLPKMNDTNAFLDWRRYCLRQRVNQTIYIPRVCSPDQEPDPYRTASYIGGLVSVPFLLVTIFVYSVLPELKNVHGTTFRCYLCCLIATYVLLAADRIPPQESNVGALCLTFGFLIYFSFLASFLWLNVLCFDMWWRFAGYGSIRGGGKIHDRKKFIGYSTYAWGTAALLTAICIGLEYSPGLSKSVITPGFRKRSCWFSTELAAALFFFGPVGLTIFCNICLFISTSVKLVQHKRNTQRQLSSADSKRHDDNKLLFSLYLKLFVIMGISWSTEVISGLWKGPKYVWYFTDMVNALQGILIFIIFVCKKKILRSLEKRFKCSLRINRNGCNFAPHSTDSRATTSSLDDSTPRPNGSIALNERMKAESSEPPNSQKAPDAQPQRIENNRSDSQ